ncbi:TolC family protein [Marinilongibacter aquaticus]|uniref:TolC family protein n=1 Tax=Marinilongibacter aquaticus TaxID=2975157 RepID=UPI0021BDE5D7|nr:TolC family protein [Marinilongibacter aquaticus]UBM58484.1 TolC family protein [Marinilongibacter aquaticus]
MRFFFPCCLALFMFCKAQAQEVLSLQNAISEALEHNYGIQVAQKQVEAAENQIYKGNAGMTPTLSWNSSVGGNLNQVNQVFLDGRKINRLGYSTSPSTNLQLTWTLYDGQRMQVLYSKLEVQGQQSLLQKKLEVQNTVANLMQVYFEILRQKKAVEYLETIISYYEERLKITEERWQIGRGSKLDYLQSKTDFTTQQVDLVNAKNNLKTAKVQLNNLLGAPANREFVADEQLNESNQYVLEELLNDAKVYNRELLVLNKSIEMNLLNEKEAQSYLKPRISLNSGFGYSFNKSNAGFLALNQSFGLNAGLTASWTIFNGHKTQRDIQLAKINSEIAETQKESLLNQIQADLTSAFYQYESDREMLDLEQANKTVAEENLTISLEKFKLGSSTILELNDAQQRFDLSLNRLVNAQFNKRISELELLRLSGTLLE